MADNALEADGAHGARRKNGRALVIALDAADARILEEQMDAGELPNLAKLRDGGAWGYVAGARGFGSAAAWTTFCTGVTPAKHGRYFYRQLRTGSYQVDPIEGQSLDGIPFWDYLSAAGKRIAILDAPSVPLSESMNGIGIADWITHDFVYGGLRTSPDALAEEVIDRFGPNPLPKCDRPGGRTREEHIEMIDQLEQRVAKRVDSNRHFYGTEDWDLFFTSFAETHCVGHQCWHLRDPRHELYEPDARPHIDDPLLGIYHSVDAAIGELLAEIDDDTTVIVFSATGMGPNYTGNLLLDEVLRRRDGVSPTLKVALTARAKRFAKRVLPNELRRRYRPLKRQVEESVQRDDRAGRLSFAIPHNDITGAIRLNLVGREPHGRLEPGEQRDRYVDELRRDLLELRNLDTGGPVIDEVIVVAEEIDGPHLDDLPDLFVRWARQSYPDRVGSDRIGTVEHRHRGNRTGDHLPHHFFLASGPGVEPGRLDGCSILDFAPTITAMLGVEPGPSDGEIIDALVSPPSSKA